MTITYRGASSTRVREVRSRANTPQADTQTIAVLR
jgi:hypothetical protein